MKDEGRGWTEQIVLNVRSDHRGLPGLENAQRRLDALSASIKSVQAQLAGLSSNAVFKLSARQYAEKAYTSEGKKQLGIGQLLRRAGFSPEAVKDARSVANMIVSEVHSAITRIEREMDNPKLGKRALDKRRQQIAQLRDFIPFEKGSFTSPTAAGKFLGGGLLDPNLTLAKQLPLPKGFHFSAPVLEILKKGYAGVALQNQATGRAALAAILGGAVPATPPPVPAPAPANLAEAVKAASKTPSPAAPATAAPSHPPATTMEHVRRMVDAQSAKAGDEATEATGKSAGLLEKKITTYDDPDKPAKVVTLHRTGPESTIEKTVVGEKTTTTVRERTGRRMERQFNDALTRLSEEYARSLSGVLNNAPAMAVLRRNTIQQAGALFRSNPQHAALGLRDRMAEFVHGDLRERAAGVRKSVAEMRAIFDAAGEAESRTMEKRAGAKARFDAQRTKGLAAGRAGIEKEREKTAAHDAAQAQQSHFNTVMTDAALRAEQALAARGARLKGYSTDLLTGRKTGATYEMAEGGYTHTFKVDYSKQAGAVTQTSREIRVLNERGQELHRTNELLGGDFVRNTAKVISWSASVAILYQSLGLAAHSLGRMVDTGYQMARLDQVFRGVGGSTRELTSDIMHLAAMNGRSTREALDSAIQWSRLGLTRAQVNEAVRTSLMAANVAEMSAAEATAHLQTVMQNYGLQVGQLRTVLGELNQISNTFNVTNNDLMQGLSRSAAVARQAGLPLSELMGILGATVGNTGQSGANIGNALKSVMLALSNPALQEKLRTGFKFETTRGGEDLKPMNEMLADLYVRYMKLNDAQRQSLLFSVAGRTQANRLAAMMNSYVQAQMLAIDAQLHLNSAEQENLKITATLKAHLAGVAAEWERFVVVQGNQSGMVTILTEISNALRNVLGLMNLPVMKQLTTFALGIGAVGMARSALGMLSLRSGGGQGFVGRTGAAIFRESMALNQASNQVLAGLMGRADASRRRDIMIRYNELAPYSGVLSRKERMELARKNAEASWYSQGQSWIGGLLNRVNSAGNHRLEAGIRNVRNMQLAMGALNLSAGAVAKSLALAGAALVEFAVPLAVVYGAMKLLDMVMEDAGQTVEGTRKRVAELGQQAETAREAANAHAEAGRAMSVFQRALTPDKAGRMRPGDVASLVDKVPGLMHLTEADATKRRELQESTRSRLEAMRKANDLAGIRNLLDKEQTEYARAMNRALNDEYLATSATVRLLDQKIRDLREQDKHSIFGHSGRAANIADLERQKAEAEGKGVRLLREQTEDENDYWESRLQYDQKHLAALEQQKVTLQSIADIHGQIDTANPLQRADVETATLKSQEMAIRSRMDALARADENDWASRQAMEDLRKKKNSELKALLDDYAQAEAVPHDREAVYPYGERENMPRYPEPGEGKRLKFWDTGGYGWNSGDYDEFLKQHKASVLREKEAAIAAKRREADFPNAMEAGPATLSMQSRQKQSEMSIRELRDNEARRRAIEGNRALTARMAQFGFGQDRAQVNVAAHRYGIDPTDRLLNERRAIQNDIQMLAAKEGRSASEHGRLIKDQNLLYQNTLALRQRHADVEAEIRQLAIDQNKEFSRSFFGSGPAEMLRKLAAFRLAMRGPVSQGQLYSMNPGMRGDVASLTGQTPERMFLENERQRLRHAAGGSDVNWGDRFDTLLVKLSDGLMRSVNAFSESLNASINADMKGTLSAATENMNKLGSAAGNAADALSRLATVLGMSALGGTGLTFQPNGQGGGWFPGK